jgi:hypothetical protein
MTATNDGSSGSSRATSASPKLKHFTIAHLAASIVVVARRMSDKTVSFAELREKLANDLLLIFLVLGLPIGLASAPRTFVDGDTSWHIAVGQWIVRNGAIPHTDPFSFTAYGKPWVAMEWLADLLFVGAYQVAGHAGLATVVAAAVMATNCIILLYLRSRVGPIGLTVAIIGMDIVLATFILARPHVLVWPLLATWTVVLSKATETGRPPPLWTALLLTLWANLHASFPIAVMIGGFLALDALIAARWKTLREWLVFAGVCLVAVCLNLNGLAGLLHPFHITSMKTLDLIAEWSPSTTRNTPQFYGALLLCFGLLLWRGIQIPIGRLFLVLSMLLLAFMQLRHQSWFAIVAAILIPPMLGSRTEASGKTFPILLAAVPLLLIRALWPLTPPESVSNPRSLLAHVPTDLKHLPVLNEYSFGGPLILAGIKPYIDGRADMYGDTFFSDYDEIARGDWNRFNRAVKRYNIRWTILQADQKELLTELDRSPHWRRIYSDKVGVIHARIK